MESLYKQAYNEAFGAAQKTTSPEEIIDHLIALIKELVRGFSAGWKDGLARREKRPLEAASRLT